MSQPKRLMPAVLLLLVGMAVQTPVAAAEETEQASFSRSGADSCLRCHDETSDFPVLSIFRTAHGAPGDERSPFGGAQCETCHGPGGDHGRRLRRGEERPEMVDFEDGDPEELNAICLDCHQSGDLTEWHGGTHQAQEAVCTDCHTVHAVRDPMKVAQRQTDTCVDCHSGVGGEILSASHHPVRDGQMACSDCHQPHGSTSEADLDRPTLNQTCYDCHAEKRGPFLWEHAPATEDCSTCHRPHGSNHPALLTRRPPLLCQQCHTAAGHPSLPYTEEGLPGKRASTFAVGQSCSNCHSQVHGSNHPSGSLLNR